MLGDGFGLATERGELDRHRAFAGLAGFAVLAGVLVGDQGKAGHGAVAGPGNRRGLGKVADEDVFLHDILQVARPGLDRRHSITPGKQKRQQQENKKTTNRETPEIGARPFNAGQKSPMVA